MARDIKLHLLVGTALAILVGSVLGFKIGFISACVVGGLKELWDLNHEGHTPDWMDFFVTCLGGAIGAFIIYLVLGS